MAPITPPINNPSSPLLVGILNKIKTGKALTPGEATYYTAMQHKMSGLPPINAGTAPSTALALGTGDRGSDPAFIAANSMPAPGTADRGADPTFKGYTPPDPSAALAAWAAQRNTAVGTGSNQTGYAPTLDQEQAQYQHNANSQGANPTLNAPAGAAAPAADQSGAANGISMVTHLPDEAMPNVPNVTLAWHDFTPQAQQKVAGAYAPLYQAINQGKTNATAQEKNSSQVVSGLYNNLATQRAADATKTAAQYDATAAASKASDANTIAQVQGAGNSVANQLAQVMAANGISGRQGTTAADELSASLGANSADVNQAQLQASNDATNIAAQKQNQLDYSTNSGAAEQRQGEAAQEGLQNQLTTALGNYDQQTLTTKADQAQQGLTLAQQMAQNDWTAQTGSADQTWNHYNAAMSQAQAKVQQDQANAGLMNQAAGMQINAQSAANQLAEQQSEFNANYNYNVTKLGMDSTAAAAKATADAAQNAATNDVAQQNAISTRINADANAMQQQGTNPNLPSYNPRMDPTSPQYLAAHNPDTMFQNTVLGIVAGGKTDPASTNLAQSWMTLAGQAYADLAARGAARGNAKLGKQEFKQELMNRAAASGGLQPAAAAAVADAWLAAHPEATS